MREPTFPLSDAVQCYIDDRSCELAESTMDVYRVWLHHFIDWLPRDQRDLEHLNIETGQRFCREGKSQHTRMNKAIALKSLGKYLATSRMWYEGEFLSVMRDLKQARPSPTGQKPYTDEEIRTMYEAVSSGRFELRNRAIFATLLHGLRAGEARCLLLRNVVPPARKEKAHLIIEESKTSSGIRQVPVDEIGYAAIREYIRLGRHETKAPELFTTDESTGFTRRGWHCMAQGLRRLCAEAGVPFRQHRLRSTSVRLKHESKWPDSANIAVHGWSPRTGQAMLARYRGPIPVEQLKTYPSTTDWLLK